MDGTSETVSEPTPPLNILLLLLWSWCLFTTIKTLNKIVNVCLACFQWSMKEERCPRVAGDWMLGFKTLNGICGGQVHWKFWSRVHVFWTGSRYEEFLTESLKLAPSIAYILQTCLLWWNLVLWLGILCGSYLGRPYCSYKPFRSGFSLVNSSRGRVFQYLSKLSWQVAPVRDARMGTSDPHSTFVASKMGLWTRASNHPRMQPQSVMLGCNKGFLAS